MARPSLADSLRASLNKGAHIETAEKIAKGFSPVTDDETPIPDSHTREHLIESAQQNIINFVTPGSSFQESLQDNVLNYAPSDRLTVSPSNGHTDREFISHTDGPSDAQTDIQSDNGTVRQSERYTDRPLDRRTVEPNDGWTAQESYGLTVKPIKQPTVSQYQTNYQTPLQYIPLEVLNLAYNQAYVLEALIANTSGITNYRTISEQTHIGIPSVREALSRLVVKGFMHKPLTVKNAAFQGFSYVLNKALCDHFIAAGGLSQENYRSHQTISQTVKPFDSIAVTQQDRQTTHSSSKVFEDLKATSTSAPLTVSQSDGRLNRSISRMASVESDSHSIRPSDGFILIGAVGAYWEEEGLSEGHAQKWCSQFETTPEQMRQQLDWARYDLEINGRRSEVKKDTVSWFFGHLRTTGGYFPRPINYKSPTEIRAELIEKDLAREQEAKERLAAAEIEQKFQRILSNPKSEEYINLYAQVNGFAKEEQGVVLEQALRDIYLGDARANKF